MVELGLKITRGDATMLYATSHGSYTIRFHLRLDQIIDGQKLRIALGKTPHRGILSSVSPSKEMSENSIMK